MMANSEILPRYSKWIESGHSAENGSERLSTMRPSSTHVYGKIKLEEDAFISCHNCDFTSYTFKGFSLHLRKVHGLSLTGKPPRRNKPRPPKTPESIGIQHGAPSAPEPSTQNSVVESSSASLSEGRTHEMDSCSSLLPHLVSEQEEMVKRLLAKREAARIRRAVRRGLRMKPGVDGQVEVSFACDRCNFTAFCRNDFQNHILRRVCH